MLIPEVEIDAKLCLNDITKKFYNILKQFAPFGPGNLSPVFQSDNVMDSGKGKIVGEKHLKLQVVHPNIRSYPISSIAFQQAYKFDCIERSRPFNIVYHIEENEWNNVVKLQLNVKDIKPFDEYGSYS